MKFNEHWLRSLVDTSLDTAQLSELLTMAGLEVEECDPVAPPFSKVVVAQVLSAEKHPDADKLKLCKVDVGEADPLQIVCGAPNVSPGMKVPCARVGAVLPGGLSIKAARVRGVESFGMLCSARELGLSDDHGGLLALTEDAPTGRDVRAQLALDDHVFLLKLTPNRADCLSLVGIAREVAALTGACVNLPNWDEPSAVIAERREIVLDAPQACARFCGRLIRGINANAPTPDWMRQRIERAGLRCINAVVDVTNYVMLELGQPLHAYDDGKLNGGLHARYARAGESLELLNGQMLALDADSLVIADEARVLGLAGIMGGEGSGVQASTTDIFLEAAWFAPDAVAGKARSFGFSSDASHRFERGVDFGNTRNAMARAAGLILSICGGQPGPVVESLSADHLPKRATVNLRTARAARVLGIDIGAGRIEGILSALGLAVERTADGFAVTPPSHRFDIEIEEDLIEEIVRVHGYDNVPAPAPSGPLAMLPLGEQIRSPWRVRRTLAARDYQEVVNFSFVDSAWERDFCANEAPVVLANPIASQMSVMRSSLIGGLVANLATNLKRKVERVRVFELGRCFSRDGSEAGPNRPVAGFVQPLRIAALAAGNAAPEQWGAATRRVDFYDVKADLEALLAPRKPCFLAAAHPALHPGRCAEVVLEQQAIGWIGELHPRLSLKYELGASPVVFELELDAVLAAGLPDYVEPSKFPSVVRDLALVVAHDLPVQTLLDGLRQAAPDIVSELEVFDVYQGKGIDPDKKSLAIRVVMKDTQRTLADDEVESARSRLIRFAEERFSARLRA
ncbi:MAG TPA: phenylalanine--tRNA ligase subunit beta [Rhodocyclaceae bacterium]|nr:phenylalanine--tRNA ligase subunit beta [Rhodocyclaceae bacterium]HMZ84518.1 phenylalanine--tRNA ligase subunit beta [Rhodocyclaceae bacterium]HNB79303.1 phenylalanine--tRNA ligase subunit beta [Rhodocyclaceae bacterium]